MRIRTRTMMRYDKDDEGMRRTRRIRRMRRMLRRMMLIYADADISQCGILHLKVQQGVKLHFLIHGLCQAT